jgi:hypothetical protein
LLIKFFDKPAGYINMSKILDLIMSELVFEVSKASWAASPNHGTELDKRGKLVDLRKKILARDNYTCSGCGLRSERWQEIHHINGHHRDDRENKFRNKMSSLSSIGSFTISCVIKWWHHHLVARINPKRVK